MKIEIIKKRIKNLLGLICLVSVMGLNGSCDDKSTTKTIDPGEAFNPSKPVVVSDFEPKTGSSQQQMLVYGSNFGNDKSRVKLYVGGKEAVVINVHNDKLYAYVPASAFGNKVEVAITDNEGNEISRGTSPEDMLFEYQRATVVGTLCGYKNSRDDQGEVFGPFETTTGFRDWGTMAFDPLYPHLLYVAAGTKMVQLDLQKRYHSYLLSRSMFQNNGMRNAAFTNDGQYMIMSVDVWGDNTHRSPSLYIVKRNADGTFSDQSEVALLAGYRQCNGVDVHPVNGEVYFNSYENGQFFRLDLEKYFAYKRGEVKDPETGKAKVWTGYYSDGCFEELFQIQDPSWEYNIVIHPTGNYAYINVINRQYIMRTDYDWEKKRFTTPYLVAGKANTAGWNDAVGGDARMNEPRHGVFVKNPEYAGRSDEYDYYICDTRNYCIRVLTPDGMMRTYAGRSPASDNLTWGADDGALRTKARFVFTTGIAYDEKNQIMYILDPYNCKVRTIGKESDD